MVMPLTETTSKKTAKRRQILEKHTPGWTQEEGEQRQSEQATTQAKPAGKNKEKTAKKTNRPREPAEEEPVVHKPIKITVRRPEPEPEDFVQKIRLGTAPEEEAETEDSSEQLVRLPPRQGWEKRAKGPALPVDDTQRRAKEPPPVAGAEGKKEEVRTAPKEAAQEPVLLDSREPVIPDMRNERVSEPESAPEKQPELGSRSKQSNLNNGLERSTKQQWLRWLSEQVSGVADQMDEEEKHREHLTHTTAQELVALRTQIQELQGELLQAKERVAEAATTNQQVQVVTEPVGTTRKQPEPEPVESEALQASPESKKVIATLREELRAQEALREKEREQQKLAEEDRRRMEEGFRKG